MLFTHISSFKGGTVFYSGTAHSPVIPQPLIKIQNKCITVFSGLGDGCQYVLDQAPSADLFEFSIWLHAKRLQAFALRQQIVEALHQRNGLVNAHLDSS